MSEPYEEAYLYRFLEGLKVAFEALPKLDIEKVIELQRKAREYLKEAILRYLKETEDLDPEESYPPLFYAVVSLLAQMVKKPEKVKVEDVIALTAGIFTILGPDTGLSPEEFARKAAEASQGSIILMRLGEGEEKEII